MRLTKTIAMIMMVKRSVPLFPRVIRRDARKKATCSSSNIAGSLFPEHEIPVTGPCSDDKQDYEKNKSGGIPVKNGHLEGFLSRLDAVIILVPHGEVVGAVSYTHLRAHET